MSPNKAVAGSSLILFAEENRAHQELLQREVQNLVLQIEAVSDNTDPLVDILVLVGQAKLALPLIKTIGDTNKVTIADSILPAYNCKEGGEEIFCPLKGP